MFRKNSEHLQPSLFGFTMQLSEKKLATLKKSKEYAFYHLVFSRINECDFECLYSTKSSRPNAPVNILVASIILMQHNNWTVEKLFSHIDFDILTRTALGLDTLDDTPFCQATFFNFRNRLLHHFIQTGENLIEQVFDTLTASQLKSLKIKTTIQRTDSFMAMSNIRSYGRTQLLIEMLLRLHRILSEADKVKFDSVLASYTKQSSSKYIYTLERSDIPHEQEKLAQIYHQLYSALKPDYAETEIFRIFERVYTEHFTIVDEKITVIPNTELDGSMLQSPDDIDATYRKKRSKGFRGQSVNVNETCHPDNDVNIITDVAVYSNITDDSKILNDRIDSIVEKTPDINELHTDGAYGSENNDKKLESHGITHVQTAVRGRVPKVAIEIDEETDGQYVVKCPYQSVSSQTTQRRFKACFDNEICSECPFRETCPTLQQAKYRVYYFTRSDYLRNRRNRNIRFMPPERRQLRPNVEATVKEFTKPFNHKGKLRVRGLFNTMLFAHSMAIAINFGRLYRYLDGGDTDRNRSVGLSTVLKSIVKVFDALFRILTLISRPFFKDHPLNQSQRKNHHQLCTPERYFGLSA